VTGNPILALRGRDSTPVYVGWSPDGMRLAAATEDGWVTVWDATRGYEIERAPALLDGLNRKLAGRSSDAESLRLRAGVYARLEEWDRAAADLARLAQLGPSTQAGLFQAGWWIADGPAPGSPAMPPALPGDLPGSPHFGSAAVGRWYVSADDPNGYVPLARGEPFYLTAVHAAHDQEVRLRFDAADTFVREMAVNGAPVTEGPPTTVPLTAGWNTIVVRLRARSPASDILSRPRIGFYLRLEPLPAR
jgi:hypothetical protein